MLKIVRSVRSVIIILLLFTIGVLLAEKESVSSKIIRLHVVANSDSKQDQNIKLYVRDAVIDYLSDNLSKFKDPVQAQQYISGEISALERVANDALKSAGSHAGATVSLRKEAFPKRIYDTFALPAGVYNSLRVTIGSGEGANWWCVVFPALCTPQTTDEFRTVAVSEGFDQGIAETLSTKDGYTCRFFLLDCLGKIENFFYKP